MSLLGSKNGRYNFIIQYQSQKEYIYLRSFLLLCMRRKDEK